MDLATVNTEVSLGMGVLVVDDHDLVRLGLKTLLDSYARTLPCSLVWFEAASLARALETYAQQRAHVIWYCWTCTCQMPTVCLDCRPFCGAFLMHLWL